jgi:hypothetical protein
VGRGIEGGRLRRKHAQRARLLQKKPQRGETQRARLLQSTAKGENRRRCRHICGRAEGHLADAVRGQRRQQRRGAAKYGHPPPFPLTRRRKVPGSTRSCGFPVVSAPCTTWPAQPREAPACAPTHARQPGPACRDRRGAMPEKCPSPPPSTTLHHSPCEKRTQQRLPRADTSTTQPPPPQPLPVPATPHGHHSCRTRAAALTLVSGMLSQPVTSNICMLAQCRDSASTVSEVKPWHSSIFNRCICRVEHNTGRWCR